MRPLPFSNHPALAPRHEHSRASFPRVSFPAAWLFGVNRETTYPSSFISSISIVFVYFFSTLNFFYMRDIRDYLDEIFILIEKHWNTSMLIPIINLVEEVSHILVASPSFLIPSRLLHLVFSTSPVSPLSPPSL